MATDLDEDCLECPRGRMATSSRAGMTKMGVFRRIIQDTLTSEMDTIEVLMHGVVLHTHAIRLRPELTLDDVDESGSIRLYPLTRNGVADVLASCWPSGDERGSPDFWIGRYRSDTAYESLSDVPRDRLALLERALRAIEKHAFVDAVIEDE
jgi:hypothetical protein